MALTLYAHPFSSYCQKVLIALYSGEIEFQMRTVFEDPLATPELEQLWPLKRFPVLVDGSRSLIEATIIIEHLDLHHRRAIRWLPDNPDAALEVRFMDRFFDNYIHSPLQRIVGNALRPEAVRDLHGVAESRQLLEQAYRWLDARMAGREWAADTSLSLADCAAGPALFYADWAHPIDPQWQHVLTYRRRLNALPAFARAIEAARPYRHYFPLGAPDRD